MGRTIELRLLPAVLGATAALVLAGAGGAVADKLITGDDVKDGSLTGRDLKTGSVRAIDLSADVRDPLQRIGHFKRYTKLSPVVASGADAYVSFTCPASNQVRAISGGGEWQGADNAISPIQVAPDEGTDNGWHAQGHNASGDADRIVLTVTCGRVAYYAADD